MYFLLFMVILYQLMIFSYFNLFMFLMLISIYFNSNLMFKFFIHINNSYLGELMWSFSYSQKMFFMFFIFISLSVYLYSSYYMLYTNLFYRFILVKLIFILSMTILIFSKSILLMFLGWDGLGISSFALILFFLNQKSASGGIITVMMNRVGDGFFLIIMIVIIMNNFNQMKYFCYSKMFLFIILILFLTKSAQFPFSTWLPLAMAAPTPISALVHSSTLVAAGIYLYLDNYLYLNSFYISNFLFFLSIFTFLFSGMAALSEMDMKKMIALSTLNQLSMMFISLSLNFFFLSFFHLISHAIFKSLLFLNGGVILHSFFSGQDSRIFNSNLQSEMLIKISTICSLFNLMGLAFLSGFFSKDALLERISTSMSMFLIGIFFFSLFLTFTFIYSLRLLRMAFFSKSYFLLLKLESNYLTIFVPLMFLSILSLLSGMFFSQYHLIFCLSPSIFKFFIFNLFIMFFSFLIPYLMINLLFQLSNSSMFSLSMMVNYLSKFPFLMNFLKLNFELGLFKYMIFVMSNYFFNKKISYSFSYYGLGIYLFFFITILLFF